jgi:hypothetical protein
VALPVYITLRRTRSIWIALAAFVCGLLLGAALEGAFFAAERLMTGRPVAFADAVASAMHFPLNFFVALLLTVAGALDPERLFLVPRIVEDILAGSGGSALRGLKISLQAFDLLASIIVPVAAALLPHRAARWRVIGVGALAITAARIGAGYLRYKEQNIVVISDGPAWLSAVHDVNLAILAFAQTLIGIGLAYLVVRSLIYLARKIWSLSSASGNAQPPIAPANVGMPPS